MLYQRCRAADDGDAGAQRYGGGFDEHGIERSAVPRAVDAL